MGNCKLMQKKYSEALLEYEEARKAVLSHNLDLKNSIMGNMAICSIEMGKNGKLSNNATKIQEGK